MNHTTPIECTASALLLARSLPSAPQPKPPLSDSLISMAGRPAEGSSGSSSPPARPPAASSSSFLSSPSFLSSFSSFLSSAASSGIHRLSPQPPPGGTRRKGLPTRAGKAEGLRGRCMLMSQNRARMSYFSVRRGRPANRPEVIWFILAAIHCDKLLPNHDMTQAAAQPRPWKAAFELRPPKAATSTLEGPRVLNTSCQKHVFQPSQAATSALEVANFLTTSCQSPRKLKLPVARGRQHATRRQTARSAIPKFNQERQPDVQPGAPSQSPMRASASARPGIPGIKCA